MANIKVLAARLKAFEDGQKANELSKLLWKPKEGIQNIRIVPYKFNPDSPFIELQFYYNLGGKHYLAPCTFGKPDPIQETVETLRSSGSNEEKAIANKLAPTTRTYAPIIVRGEEDKGVRFWGFGVQVYKQLLKLITDPEWGDITSLTEGNDIKIEFHKVSKKVGKDGKSFPETTITPLPRRTPVVDPSRRDLMEMVKDQTDIHQIFPLKSYEELKEAVENWLHPTAAAPSGPETTVVGEVTDPVVDNTTADASAGAPASVSATQVGEDLAGQFESFFKTR
jgi:hypothetical protein